MEFGRSPFSHAASGAADGPPPPLSLSGFVAAASSGNGPDDATDWTMTELRNLDALMRCAVCLEFFNTAMMVTHCSHTFCSLCVRRHVEADGRCPSCLKATSSLDLKNNRLLDDLVAAFVHARPRLLELQRSSNTTMAMTTGAQAIPSSGSPGVAPPIVTGSADHHRRPSQTVNTQPASSFVLRSTAHGTAAAASSANAASLGSIAASAAATGTFAPSTGASRSPPSDFDDADYMPSRSAAQRTITTTTPTTTTTSTYFQARNQNAAPTVPAKDAVACPVCSQLVAGATINVHLDACLNGLEASNPRRVFGSNNAGTPSPPEVQPPTTRASSVSPSSERRQPLAKPVYNVMTEKNLRKALKDHGLSSTGDRSLLIWRHKEFVLQYNAQCDALHPKPMSWILQQVEKEEKHAGKERERDRAQLLERDKEKEKLETLSRLHQQRKLLAPLSDLSRSSTPTTDASTTPTTPGAIFLDATQAAEQAAAAAAASAANNSTPVVEQNRGYVQQHASQFAALIQQVRQQKRKLQATSTADSEENPAPEIDDDDDSTGMRKRFHSSTESTSSTAPVMHSTNAADEAVYAAESPEAAPAPAMVVDDQDEFQFLDDDDVILTQAASVAEATAAVATTALAAAASPSERSSPAFSDSNHSPRRRTRRATSSDRALDPPIPTTTRPKRTLSRLRASQEMTP
ncbi:hypothetical protein CAOG_002219 [Capsaspora owczarzaki ATCC 30864]|uniref:RING-type E3 ubiquitin transferase n=1 Tax=Capsaspora owczarzaki (strain ATCC 30864) TaxID=595528 RepID=A0A0D2WKV7_CAPO3|nr:hypothetical protein CAOG_002219 [Capsaspora owczarzaki ATCC 30864]